MEVYIVDRIENAIAVLEAADKTFIRVPLSRFASNVREGDVVVVGKDGSFQPDAEKTAARRKQLFQLQKNIFSD